MMRKTISPIRSASIALLLSLSPVYPAIAAETSLATETISSLEPGEYIWSPQASESGAVEIVVSIPDQMAYVYRGGALIGASTVSTGREGHETPTGRFEILQKRREHYSNLYDNAPMPFMQRLTWDGIALHGGHVPGHPASHGCVRLPQRFARSLYEVTRLGAAVHITDLSVSAEDALAMVGGGSGVELAAID